MFLFNRDIGRAIKQACDLDTDALTLAKAAKILRRDMFEHSQELFNGLFIPDCQQESVPLSMLSLVSMTLDGPSIEDQSTKEHPHVHACLTIAQLMAFNTVKTRYSATQRHHIDRETPLPNYLVLKIQGESRNRTLIDKFHKIGLCIYYDRVLSISTDIGNSVCSQYEQGGVVCPPSLVMNIFTTASVDNIDHNPSSTTAKDSFHGTGISIMQHPTEEYRGTPRQLPVFNEQTKSTKSNPSLPTSYTEVLPAVLKTNDPIVPHIKTVKLDKVVSDPLANEYKWLQHFMELFEKPEVSKDDWVSWAAYEASLQPLFTDGTTNVALMPLFLENAHSVAMILHSMNVVKAVIHHINLSQIPVLVMDQPLFALAMKIQWNFPDILGEDKFFVMSGGLHIEMVSLKILGDWLQGSGWSNLLYKAGIASSGICDSFLKATHVTRTRHAHQVTAAALYILQHRAHQVFAATAVADYIEFEPWRIKKLEEQPQFLYWSKVMQLELCLLKQVGSIRKGHFADYCEAITHLIAWTFSLDHTNYARWLSVHIRDMCSLVEEHPSLYQEFTAGRFVYHKTSNPFSGKALDQAHEQVN